MSRKSIVVVALLLALAAGIGVLVHRISNARGVTEIVIEAPGWRILTTDLPAVPDRARVILSPETALRVPAHELPPPGDNFIESGAWVRVLLAPEREAQLGVQHSIMSFQTKLQSAIGAVSWRSPSGESRHGFLVASASLVGEPDYRGLVIELEPMTAASGAIDEVRVSSLSDVEPQIDGEFVKGARGLLTGVNARFTVTVPPPATVSLLDASPVAPEEERPGLETGEE